ncbi:MAG TPA: hypothetical protein PK600_02765 [Deltaproteobacteria bacterium]|nr:hypothetical protein [Deltaproteobacteria bacterium]
MHAIARVNRVFKDKPGGLVADYLGIAAGPRKSLSFYSDRATRACTRSGAEIYPRIYSSTPA